MGALEVAFAVMLEDETLFEVSVPVVALGVYFAVA